MATEKLYRNTLNQLYRRAINLSYTLATSNLIPLCYSEIHYYTTVSTYLGRSKGLCSKGTICGAFIIKPYRNELFPYTFSMN